MMVLPKKAAGDGGAERKEHPPLGDNGWMDLGRTTPMVNDCE